MPWPVQGKLGDVAQERGPFEPCVPPICQPKPRAMPLRRTLLAGLTATALWPVNSRSALPKFRVAVVGAGISGLSAAVALRNAGAEVVIVEARKRIGGRIYTSHAWRDMPMDLGASWIHGIDGNPVTELAVQARANVVTTSYENTMLHIDPSLAALGVVGRGTDYAEGVLQRAMAWAEQQTQDVSIQKALDAVAPTGPLSLPHRAQLDFHVSATYEQEYSGSAKAMSAWTIDDNEQFDGPDALFPGGYGQIVDFLSNDLDIRLNRVVKYVRTDALGVSLSFVDGTTMTADHVLMTVPLGVLKAETIRFDPPLSQAKQNAISRLGMGLLNKHWLRFDSVFWPKSFDWHEYLSDQKGKWSEWVSLAKVENTPVLMVFSAADHAVAVESMDDTAILADIMGVARKMFGSATPNPVAWQNTRWRSDPFARGSYSFNAIGSSNSDRKALGQAEADRLHFAGEAVSHQYPGTVHGALISGREAARRIVVRHSGGSS